MKIVNKILFFSLAVVWLSVFSKYRTFAFLSRSHDTAPQQDGQTRLRQAIREKLHSRSDDSSQEKSRLRDAVKDKLHHVKDKIVHHKTTTKVFYPVQPQNPQQPRNPNVYNPQQPHNPNVYNPQPPQNPNVYNPQAPFNPNAYNPQPPQNPNVYYPQAPYNPYAYGNSGSPNSGVKDKVKGFVMAGLAKKIMGSGKHHGYNNHDLNSGYYNGYNYRPGQYATIHGSVCTNNYDYSGLSFGQFRCPMEGYDYTATACCGPVDLQYCCSPNEAVSGYGSSGGYGRSSFLLAVIFVPLIFMALIGGGVALFCVYKKRIYEKVST